MSDLRDRLWRPAARVAALAWLLVIAPVELASALAGLISGPRPVFGIVATLLVAMRVLVTAAGLILGRQLAQHATGLRPWALTWAAADLVTLAIALASASLPSNRLPGDGPLIWFGYALAAAVVTAAASTSSRDSGAA